MCLGPLILTVSRADGRRNKWIARGYKDPYPNRETRRRKAKLTLGGDVTSRGFVPRVRAMKQHG